MLDRSKQFWAIIVALSWAAVALGVALLFNDTIKFDAASLFLVVIIFPCLLYLVLSERLSKLSIFGASAEFLERKLGEAQDEVVQSLLQEPRRAEYLGKLKQVIRELERGSVSRFCLIYADIDGLRKITRHSFCAQETTRTRKSENDFRAEIVRVFMFALVDGLYRVDIPGVKYDVFELNEPDVILILRDAYAEQAQRICEAGLEIFRRTASSSAHPYDATIVVVWDKGQKPLSARDYDQKASELLRQAKAERGRGKVTLCPAREHYLFWARTG